MEKELARYSPDLGTSLDARVYQALLLSEVNLLELNRLQAELQDGLVERASRQLQNSGLS